MSEPAVTHLKPKLGLRDVTLLAIACMVGSRWIPAAAHAGPGSVTLWLAAAVLFAVPLAAAVGALAMKYPGRAGGLYVWTREDFGPWHGFLCFWVYWIGIAFLLPTAALFYMSAGIYALGPKYAHLGDNRLWILAAAPGGAPARAAHCNTRPESTVAAKGIGRCTVRSQRF